MRYFLTFFLLASLASAYRVEQPNVVSGARGFTVTAKTDLPGLYGRLIAVDDRGSTVPLSQSPIVQADADGALAARVGGLAQEATTYTLILVYSETLPPSPAGWAQALRWNLGKAVTINVFSVLFQPDPQLSNRALTIFLNRIVAIAPDAAQAKALMLNAAEFTLLRMTADRKAAIDTQAAEFKTRLEREGVQQ